MVTSERLYASISGDRRDGVRGARRGRQIGVRRRRFLLVGFALYLMALHGVVALLVFKTNFLLLAGKTLGWLPSEEWNEQLLLRIVEHAKRDRGVEPGAVLLIGDSIIAQLDTKLIARNAVNFGGGGDTMRTLLARLPVLRSLDTAASVVLGVGTNDLKYRDVSEIAPDYAAVMKALPPALPLIVVSVLPVDEQTDEMRKRGYLRNGSIRALNLELRRLCGRRPGCRFLDAASVMADPVTGALRSALHADDGWHLSAQGSAVLADLIGTVLRQGATAPAPTP